MAKQATPAKVGESKAGESTEQPIYVTTSAVCLRGVIIPKGQAVELTPEEAASLIGVAVTEVKPSKKSTAPSGNPPSGNPPQGDPPSGDPPQGDPNV